MKGVYVTLLLLLVTQLTIQEYRSIGMTRLIDEPGYLRMPSGLVVR